MVRKIGYKIDVATQDDTTFVYDDVSGQVTKETTKLTKNKDVVKNYSYDSAGNKSAFKIKVGDDTSNRWEKRQKNEKDKNYGVFRVLDYALWKGVR